MTREEKSLLLKDLCARLPYGVIVHIKLNHNIHCPEYDSLLHGFMLRENVGISQLDGYTKFINLNEDEVKPYLRPMSSMTKEERCELADLLHVVDEPSDIQEIISLFLKSTGGFDWLNTHHFDYCGLIKMGLALEAPENMYKTE